MKPVIIIAIAFVLLIPTTVFAQESGYPLKLDTSKENQCKYPDGYCMEKWGMNNPEGYNSCLASVIASCESQPKTVVTCEGFELGEYTPIEDYDLIYELYLQGFTSRDESFSRVLIDNYKGTIQYEKECQSFYKEYQQLTKESERWMESCPAGNPNWKKYHMSDIFNICRYATLVPVEQTMVESEIVCGKGTVEKNGQCVPDKSSSKGGGCLIATATYGSELSPQVQQLREIRDNSLLQTESGTSFMGTFNDVYYSFSPIIADYERENPVFREMVKVAITPMISSLSVLNYVDMDSEESVLGYGISLIVFNLMMYVGIPVVAIMRLKKNRI